MKLLVFAHTPPPLHGQSLAVQSLLDGFGGDRRTAPQRPASSRGIECYHVNSRLSSSLEDVGSGRWQKMLRLAGYCLEAIRVRFRHGPRVLYFVPAAPMRNSLYRDWVVMALCRPFFQRVVFHWEAEGLADWLETNGKPWERRLSQWLLGGVDLSIVLSRSSRSGASKLAPRRIEIVPNGIEDPVPNFAPGSRSRDPRFFRALFLGHCTRGKGLFDAVDGVAGANAALAAAGEARRVTLEVAGLFPDAAERQEFDARLCRPDLALPGGGCAVRYGGFADTDRKRVLFAASDCLLFPTYYYAESLSLVILEAMAWDVPVLTTRWRSIPDIFPEGYPWLVEPKDPEAVARALVELSRTSAGPGLRVHFLKHYTADRYHDRMAEAIGSLDR